MNLINGFRHDIEQIEDETVLRSIRDSADERLQKIRDEKERLSKEELEKKYKDKYLLIYGKAFTMSSTYKNENDITIVHVKDIDFQGHGFFRCSATELHIEYDTESNAIKHLVSNDFGECKISFDVNDQYDVRESEIEKIIDLKEVKEIIAKAREYQNKIMDVWDV